MNTNAFRVINRFFRYRQTMQPLFAKKSYELPKLSLKSMNIMPPGSSSCKNIKHILSISILTWLGLRKSEELEEELITTIKRAILLKNKEEYAKCEKMLHVALRQAQQTDNQKGITYIYDALANLAFDTGQFEKAEKLFVSVFQRLLADGVKEDDIRCIHISLKLARIYSFTKNMEKANAGFEWCISEANKLKDSDPEMLHLSGVIYDWYSQHCLSINKPEECIQYLRKAYEVCTEILGKGSDEAIVLLNDLGVTSWQIGDMNAAEQCFTDALKIAKDDHPMKGVLHANFGLILLQKGLMSEAEAECNRGWVLGKRNSDANSTEQSTYCLDQIKEMKKGKLLV